MGTTTGRAARIALAMLAVVGLAACDGVWTQFRAGPERTGFNADESKITPANVASLQVAWQVELPTDPAGGTAAYRMVVADGKVFAPSNDGRLHALDGATGAEVWSVAAAGATEVAIAGGRVFVTSSDRNLTALDIDTGARLWRTPLLGAPGAPTVAGGLVYVVGSDNWLRTYDVATGALTGPGFAVGERGQVTISATDGSVYIRSGTAGEGYLLQAHNADGTLRWSTALRNPWTVMVAEGRVYAGGRALDSATGDVIWQLGTADWYTSMAYAGGTLYGQRTFELGITALDPATGAVRWTSQPGFAFPPYDDGPAVTDGLVWTVAASQVRALDAATGAVLWSSDPSNPVSNNMPIVAGGRVYSFDASRTIVAWKLP